MQLNSLQVIFDAESQVAQEASNTKNKTNQEIDTFRD